MTMMRKATAHDRSHTVKGRCSTAPGAAALLAKKGEIPAEHCCLIKTSGTLHITTPMEVKKTHVTGGCNHCSQKELNVF